MRLFEDDDLAVANIWAEARGESFEGMVAVGEVMRNRMRHKYFSDGTIADTVFYRYQFSGFNDSNPWRHEIFTLDNSDALVRSCFQAWLTSATTNLTNGAVLYCNLQAVMRAPNWAIPADQVAVVGHHTFYLPQNLRGR